MFYFISSGNLPLDLEQKVCFRGNSAPFWHKRFFFKYNLANPEPSGAFFALSLGQKPCLSRCPLFGMSSSLGTRVLLACRQLRDLGLLLEITTFQSQVHTHHPQHPQGISLFLQKTKISFDPWYWAAASEPFCCFFPKKHYH